MKALFSFKCMMCYTVLDTTYVETVRDPAVYEIKFPPLKCPACGK